MYYVYILQSKKDSRYYIGQAADIEKRLHRHNSGGVIATRNRRPLNLIYSKEFHTRAEAMKYEKYIKSLKGGVVFKKLLTEDFRPRRQVA